MIRWFSEHHIYAPDLRGCGKSGRVPRGYQIEEFASDIAEFIQVQIAKPVVIIGHSLGAAVTIKVTADFPALVRAVILEEPGLYLPEFFKEWRVYPWLRFTYELISLQLPAEEITRRLLDRFGGSSITAQVRGKYLAHLDPDVLAQLFDDTMSKGFNVDTLLEQITCPVLLIHGEPALGSVLRAEDLDRAATHLQDGTIVGLKRMGHIPHIQSAVKFNQIVSKFLKTLSPL